MSLTKKQSEVIEDLEKAFARCSKLGIKFCGMDDNIYYATKKAYLIGQEESDEKVCGYHGVAHAYQSNFDGTGVIDSKRSYLDSGGW